MILAAAPVSQPDVSVSRADIASVRGRLRSYQARYAPFFGRRELRGHARAYLRGLPGDEPRKSIERMVLRRHGADPNAVRTQQLFLRKARWDDAPILAAHRALVAATLGVADRLPRAAWRPFILREGSKDPQAVLCAVLRVAARRGHEPSPDVWLLLRRHPATDELKGYLSNGPAEMTPERLVWLAGLRGPIEQCFRDGKQLFGLGDYEGRSWQGWHRHATLVMLAHFFVVRERLRLPKNSPA